MGLKFAAGLQLLNWPDYRNSPIYIVNRHPPLNNVIVNRYSIGTSQSEDISAVENQQFR